MSEHPSMRESPGDPCSECCGDREDLGDGDGEHDRAPEPLQRRRLEGLERRDVDVAAEQRVEPKPSAAAEVRITKNTPWYKCKSETRSPCFFR